MTVLADQMSEINGKRIGFSLITIVNLLILTYYVKNLVPEQTHTVQVNNTIEYDENAEQERLRSILTRGCQVAYDLDQFSTNGTSFNDLIALHRRVHDFADPLWTSESECTGRIVYDSNMVYNIEPIETEPPISPPPPSIPNLTICLPRKCGTSSWQRALSSQLTYLYWQRRVDHRNDIMRIMSEQRYGWKVHNFTQALTSDELKAPRVYFTTALFRTGNPIKADNPFRVINVRSPFDRLHSAFTDKMNMNESAFFREGDPTNNGHSAVAHLFNAIKLMEEDHFTIEKGFFCSFEAFIKYIMVSETKSQNGHWRSFFWDCRPCQFKYNFIFNLERIKQQSSFLFEQLNYTARLPKEHHVKVTARKAKENPYENLPRSAVEALYRKYYLDFVLLGFDVDDVLSIVNQARGQVDFVFDREVQPEVDKYLNAFVVQLRDGNHVSSRHYETCERENDE